MGKLFGQAFSDFVKKLSTLGVVGNFEVRGFFENGRNYYIKRTLERFLKKNLENVGIILNYGFFFIRILSYAEFDR